jgi:phage tail-like protein
MDLATLAFSKIRLDPHLGCNFYVEIDGLIAGQFREVRGLEGSIKMHEYKEGGLNTRSHKFAGEAEFPNLTLSKGVTDMTTLWDWYADVANGIITRRSLSLTIMDAARYPIMWWDVMYALPVKWTGPSFDARSGEVAVESLELIHKGISKPFFSDVVSAVRLGIAIAGNFT